MKYYSIELFEQIEKSKEVYYELLRKKPYIVSVNFIYNLLNCFFITHIILLQGMYQFIPCNEPRANKYKTSKAKIVNEDS